MDIKTIRRVFKSPIRAMIKAAPDIHVINVMLGQLWYCLYNKRFAPLKHPADLNDYIFSVKSNHLMSNYGCFVDKELVKKFIASMVSDDYIIPTLGVFRNVSELWAYDHPERYIVKPTHLSGETIIKDAGRLSRDELKQCQHWLNDSLFKLTREYNYRNLEPKIIIEPMLTQGGEQLTNYRFFIVKGQCLLIQVDTYEYANLYTRAWEKPNVYLKYTVKCAHDFEKPATYDEMLTLAEKLGSLFDFSRIDLYETDQGVKFGEITLTPYNAMLPFEPYQALLDLYEPLKGHVLQP